MQKCKSKTRGRGCNARYPLMKVKVYSEFLMLKKEGSKVKRWCLITAGAKQLMTEVYLDVKGSKYSDKLFMTFRTTKNINFKIALLRYYLSSAIALHQRHQLLKMISVLWKVLLHIDRKAYLSVLNSPECEPQIQVWLKPCLVRFG